MPRGIPNKKPEATPFEPPTAVPVVVAAVAELAKVPQLTLEEREGHLASQLNELQARLASFEAEREAFVAYVENFGRSLAKRDDLPKTITLYQAFGFMENGTLRHWHADRAITDPADIVLLFAKKAPIEGFEHE